MYPSSFSDFKKQQKRKDREGRALQGFWWDVRELVDQLADGVTTTFKGLDSSVRDLSANLPSWLQLPESSSLPSNDDLQVKIGKVMIGGAAVISTAVIVSYAATWLSSAKPREDISSDIPEKIAPANGIYQITPDSARARQKHLSRSR